MKNKKNKENKSILTLIVAIIVGITLISSGTFAWWTWNSSSQANGTGTTDVSFKVTGGSMTIDGEGSITNQKLAPTDECNHNTYAIYRTVTVNATNETNTSMTASVQINTSGLPSALKKSTFKYYISETAGCNIAGTGNFSGTSPVTLTTFNVPANDSVEKTYYFYAWLDSTETSNASQNQPFSMTWAGKLVQNAS